MKSAEDLHEKSKRTPQLDPFAVGLDELTDLIRARTERDLILGVAATVGCDSYRMDELIAALLKLNGMVPGDKNA